jgi:hypothetical protein
MTTLELIRDSSPYRFKSLGVIDYGTGGFNASTDFPINTEYVLTGGKFPLTDYKDMFSKSGLYHTLNDNIKVKITGFNNSCQEGQINKYGSCNITVEKKTLDQGTLDEEILGGRKKRGSKNKSNRRKSNRRKSNRRKSNRRR